MYKYVELYYSVTSASLPCSLLTILTARTIQYCTVTVSVLYFKPQHEVTSHILSLVTVVGDACLVNSLFAVFFSWYTPIHLPTSPPPHLPTSPPPHLPTSPPPHLPTSPPPHSLLILNHRVRLLRVSLLIPPQLPKSLTLDRHTSPLCLPYTPLRTSPPSSCSYVPSQYQTL